MADGTISISIEVDGKQVNIASKELDNLEAAGYKAGGGARQAKDGLKDVGKESTKASSNVKKFVTSLGLVALGAAAFKTLNSSMDAAITRFDTLNKFPKVLQALGVSAEDSERAIAKLSEGIDGLPTLLNDIASTTQRMYTSFNDIDKATDSALALNNALLASGANAADAQRGTDQYIKALQTGKMDMNTWTSLQNTMNLGLVKISEAFEMTEQEMYKALQSGGVSMTAFNDKMIELGTGTGDLANLAKVNSLGIATSLSNLRTSASRGLADIIKSFNNLSKEVTNKDIAEHIDSLKVIINSSFKVIGSVIEGTTPIVKGFANAVSFSMPVLRALSPVLIGMATAYAMHSVINKTAMAIEKSKKITEATTTVKKLAKRAMDFYTTSIKGNTAANMLNSAQANITTIAQAAQTTAIKAGMFATQVYTGQITVMAAVKKIATIATTTLGAAIKVMLGPVGLATIAIGALVGAAVGIVKWFKRSSEESKRLNKETEKLGESTSALNDAVNSSSDAYKQNQRESEATAKANVELGRKIEDLARKESKSATDKALLNDYIQELNESVTDLNLAYDEEADALNMSSEQLLGRINLMKEEEKLLAVRERQVEISKEINNVEMQLGEINALRKEWNQMLEDGSVKSREHQKALEGLDEQEASLKETLAQLAIQQAETEEQRVTSVENITKAVEEGNLRQINSFENLEGKQKEVFDNMKTTYDNLKDAATDAFDKIDTKTEHTMKSMTETMLHNQKVVEEWGANQAKLMQWAGENGYDNFIPYIENMGIDSAAELAVLAKAGEDELEKFANVLENGAVVAGDSLKTSLGNEFDGVIDAMVNFIDDGSKSLREQIKKSKFDEIGAMIPDGVVAGVDEGTPKVEKASAEMAKAAAESFKHESEIKSPSRVFKEFGTDLTEGLVIGINQGTLRVIEAVKKMFSDVVRETNNALKDMEKTFDRLPQIAHDSMVSMLSSLKSDINKPVDEMKKLATNLRKPFDNLQTDFNSIGRNAMSGLNAGLNAGRSQVMSTANSIANQVANTMQKALKIHSPSRIMRDDVGKWIPEGLALGIKDNAKSVYRELDNLSNNMMIMSTPEAALGLSRMGMIGSSHISSSGSIGTNKVINNDKGNTIVIHKIENYADTDIPKILEESAWIMDRERRRLDE